MPTLHVELFAGRTVEQKRALAAALDARLAVTGPLLEAREYARALRELATEGAILRVQGVGSFVAPRKGSAPLLGVKNIADEYGLHSVLVTDDAANSDLALTDWVLVTRNAKILQHPQIAGVAQPIEYIPRLGVWTDDFNNLFRILK